MRGVVGRSVLLAGVASLIVASSALASAPARVLWFGGGLEFVLAADTGACSFDVDVAFPPAKEYALLFSNPDGSGRVGISGALMMSTTNLATGTSRTWNVSGAGGWTFDASGNQLTSVGHGPNVAWGSLLPFQTNGFRIYTGLIDYINGTFSGHVEDVCAALAA